MRNSETSQISPITHANGTNRFFGHIAWLGPIRMLVIAIIAFGYASTMPRGPAFREYLCLFGCDPSWYGISVLFMLSGFLAAKTLHRHGSAVKMLASRAARILPTLTVFALLVLFVLYPLFGTAADAGAIILSDQIRYFFNVVSCLNADEPTPGLLDDALYMCMIQGGLWTLRWGAIAYTGTVIAWKLGLLQNRNRLLWLTLSSTLGFVVLFIWSEKWPDTRLELPLTAMRLSWAFLVGMCAFGWRNKLSRNMLIPAGFLGISAVHYYVLPWTPLIEISAMLGWGYLVWIGISSTSQLPGLLKKLPDISLGLYVFNWPATQIILFLIPGISPLTLFAYSLPVTILLALASWWVLSRPIQTWLQLRGLTYQPQTQT